MNDELIQRIKESLRQSWSKDTCLIYDEEYPYYGQCAQTAIIVQEKFGGEILKTKGWASDNGYGRHFYNRINGIIYDFTAEQFTDMPDYTHNIIYENMLSSIDEAKTETSNKQIEALRYAFNNVFEEKQT